MLIASITFTFIFTSVRQLSVDGSPLEIFPTQALLAIIERYSTQQILRFLPLPVRVSGFGRLRRW